jgi:hypothetical protein
MRNFRSELALAYLGFSVRDRFGTAGVSGVSAFATV